jgi:FkbM family methyltransferase
MLLNLENLIKKYNLNLKGVLHIGAHFGREMDAYKKANIKNVMFFEPLPHTFEKLKQYVGENNAIFVNKALGNKIGKADMYVEYDNESQSSSLLEPMLHVTQYPNIKFNDKIEVEIDKLDNIPYNRNDFNFINIDVQGYELEVFKGAIKSLNTIDIIMTEINRANLYKDCVLEDELDEFLLKHYNFKRVETFWAGGTWGDALYIKNK